LQSSDKLVIFSEPATFKEIFPIVKEISFLEHQQPARKYRAIAKKKQKSTNAAPHI
jgi:hypothetical protein